MDVPRPGPDGVITLAPSRRRWLVLLAICVVIVAVAGSIAVERPGPGAIVTAGAFGALALLCLSRLRPGAVALRLTPQALELRTGLKVERHAWNAVERFRVYEIHTKGGTRKQVGFDFRDRTPDRQTFWQTVGRGMTGVDGAIPDEGGLDHEDLAELLNAYRRPTCCTPIRCT